MISVSLDASFAHFSHTVSPILAHNRVVISHFINCLRISCINFGWEYLVHYFLMQHAQQHKLTMLNNVALRMTSLWNYQKSRIRLNNLFIQPDLSSANKAAKFKQKKHHMLTLFSIDPNNARYNPRGMDLNLVNLLQVV